MTHTVARPGAGPFPVGRGRRPCQVRRQGYLESPASQASPRSSFPDPGEDKAQPWYWARSPTLPPDSFQRMRVLDGMTGLDRVRRCPFFQQAPSRADRPLSATSRRWPTLESGGYRDPIGALEPAASRALHKFSEAPTGTHVRVPSAASVTVPAQGSLEQSWASLSVSASILAQVVMPFLASAVTA